MSCDSRRSLTSLLVTDSLSEGLPCEESRIVGVGYRRCRRTKADDAEGGIATIEQKLDTWFLAIALTRLPEADHHG